MKSSLRRALVVARREYLTTVRRPQFAFALLFTPALLFGLAFVTGKLQLDASRRGRNELHVIAVVDSAGLFAGAPDRFSSTLQGDGAALPAASPDLGSGLGASDRTVSLVVRRYAGFQVALDSLGAGKVTEVVVIAPDFLSSGAIRRYEPARSPFASGGSDRALRQWLTRSLLAGRVDPARADRVLQLERGMEVYAPTRPGVYRAKDQLHDLVSYFLPFLVGLVLTAGILLSSQYLLAGLSEEKESRILESMLCTLTVDDLLLGKLLGLGAVGLTIIGAWGLLGLEAGGGILTLAHVEVAPAWALYGGVFFLLGYLFYGSLMTGIGAITNNFREAQQIAMTCTLMNMVPYLVLRPMLSEPNGPLAIALSLFPPTAPSAMLMRMAACNALGVAVPPAQIALSIGLLAMMAAFSLFLSARVFRLGLLLYGKTPNLPGILRLLRGEPVKEAPEVA